MLLKLKKECFYFRNDLLPILFISDLVKRTLTEINVLENVICLHLEIDWYLQMLLKQKMVVLVDYIQPYEEYCCNIMFKKIGSEFS